LQVCIGHHTYQVYKNHDPETNQRCLSFDLNYPKIDSNVQPCHWFMSAYKQCIDTPPDQHFQHLLFAADPYETVWFKIPNAPIDKGEGRFITLWDPEDKKFILTLYFMNSKDEKVKLEPN
jgi:splicing factor 3A subunit 2